MSTIIYMAGRCSGSALSFNYESSRFESLTGFRLCFFMFVVGLLSVSPDKSRDITYIRQRSNLLQVVVHTSPFSLKYCQHCEIHHKIKYLV
jgi:hypothetical protein